MKEYIFFGDSITSGENNNFKSYVDYLKLDGHITNNGVSGTTFGRYSLYPVNDSSLETLLEGTNPQEATNTTIFISFGPNDCSSACLKYTTSTKILIDFVRCIDAIRQKFKGCEIIFLGISLNYSKLTDIAQNQHDYLKLLYFEYIQSELNFKNFVHEWILNYYLICKTAAKLCDGFYIMLPSDFDMIADMDNDKLHPNDEGYQKIAKKLNQELKSYLTF